MFMCAFHPEISSFFGKSFLFLFPFLCLIYLIYLLSCIHSNTLYMGEIGIVSSLEGMVTKPHQKILIIYHFLLLFIHNLTNP
jgi:hypothetical protein